MKSTVLAACSAVLGVGLAACDSAPSEADSAQLAALEAQVASLEQRKQRIEDINAIERLQHAMGYYADRALWDEVANLFADDGTFEFGLDGVYVGKERVREYLLARGEPTDGQLYEQLLLMPVITLAPDGRSAKARWRTIGLLGTLGRAAFWAEGPSENEYVKDDGVWKIKSLHWYQALLVPYAEGWQTSPDPTGGTWVSSTLPPDRPPSVAYKTWPDTYVPPFSFANPVGKYVASE